MRLVFFLLRLFYIFPLFRHRLTTQGSFLFVSIIIKSCLHSVRNVVSYLELRSNSITSDVFLSFCHVLLRFSLIFRLISVFGFQGTSWLKLALLPLTVLSVIKKHTWSALWSPVKLLSWLSFFLFWFFLLRISASGDGEIRTLDPLLARQVLSQLSYAPIL